MLPLCWDARATQHGRASDGRCQCGAVSAAIDRARALRWGITQVLPCPVCSPQLAPAPHRYTLLPGSLPRVVMRGKAILYMTSSSETHTDTMMPTSTPCGGQAGSAARLMAGGETLIWQGRDWSWWQTGQRPGPIGHARRARLHMSGPARLPPCLATSATLGTPPHTPPTHQEDGEQEGHVPDQEVQLVDLPQVDELGVVEQGGHAHDDDGALQQRRRRGARITCQRAGGLPTAAPAWPHTWQARSLREPTEASTGQRSAPKRASRRTDCAAGQPARAGRFICRCRQALRAALPPPPLPGRLSSCV